MRLGEAFGLAPQRQENTDACPDCRADVELTEEYPNVWQFTVLHDDTCPWYGDYQTRVRTR